MMPKLNYLTMKQRRFIDGLFEGKTQVQSYRDAGYTAKNDNSAWSSASLVLNNPKVQEEIEKRNNLIVKQLHIRLARTAEVAQVELLKLIQSGEKKDSVKLRACVDVLDRIGLKPTEKIDMKAMAKVELKWADVLYSAANKAEGKTKSENP